MVIYADILILVNFLVDFFLLEAARLILRRSVKTGRMLLGAAVGGIGSLYIFLPVESRVFDLIFRIIVSAVGTLTAFGFGGFKRFIKANLVLLAVSCGYGGIMTFLWRIFSPKGMAVINSVVYFNISPLVLIGVTVGAYIIWTIIFGHFSRTAKCSEDCSVTLFADGHTADFKAILDTGNSISDNFGKSEIIVADRSVAVSLFGNCDTEENVRLRPRYRIVPCRTVSGSDLLEGFRCDKAKIKSNGKTVTLQKPILAVSKTPLSDDFEGIINPDIFG